MSPQKKRLIIILAIGAALALLHKILDQPYSGPAQDWYLHAGWHYYLVMAYMAFVLGYIWTRRCPQCKAQQIYRGVHPSQWRWPGETCWKCGAKQ